jgi:hypothetical protein
LTINDELPPPVGQAQRWGSVTAVCGTTCFRCNRYNKLRGSQHHKQQQHRQA